MANFVLGFLFDPDYDVVVLIKKERPTWQAGAWNGVGGRVEEGETSHAAMVREFEEETGVFVADWQHYITEFFPDGKLEVFWASSEDISEIESCTDEEVAGWLVTEILGGNQRLVKDVAHYINLALRCRESIDEPIAMEDA